MGRLVRRYRILLLLFVPAIFVAQTATSPAIAHDPFEITLAGNVYPDRVELEVVQSLQTSVVATGICESAPVPHDCVIDSAAKARVNFTAYEQRLRLAAEKLFDLESTGKTLEVRSTRVVLTEENDLQIDLQFEAAKVGELLLRANFLQRLSDTHGVAFNIVQREPAAVLAVGLLRKTDRGIEAQVLPPPSEPDSGATPTSTPDTNRWGVFVKFSKLGLEHITYGLDHLLFVAGLLIACRGLRAMLIIVTCFTLAHSVTLTLAVLDVQSLAQPIVEPLIATSILYVGVENMVVRAEPRGRWLLTIAFGLLHGFGFAGALRQLGLGQGVAGIGLPLFAFNLGIEVGQLAICLIALPVLLELRRQGWFGRRELQVASALIAAFGAYWLIERTLL